jgi:hypothetical protein
VHKYPHPDAPSKILAALCEYGKRLVPYVDELVMQLDRQAGRPVNASRWLNFYSFDVMGDLAFGESFNLLKSGENHFALQLLQQGMKPVGILTPIPWILPILLKIPGAANGTKIFTSFIEGQAAHRRKVSVGPWDRGIPHAYPCEVRSVHLKSLTLLQNRPFVPDITSWLIEAEENSAEPLHKNPRQVHFPEPERPVHFSFPAFLREA